MLYSAGAEALEQLPGEAMGAPSLETLGARLEVALTILM